MTDYDLESVFEQTLPITETVQSKMQQYMTIMAKLQNQHEDLKNQQRKLTSDINRVKQELATLMRLYGVGELSAEGITFSIATKQRKKKPTVRTQKQLLQQLVGTEKANLFFNQLEAHTEITTVETLNVKNG